MTNNEGPRIVFCHIHIVQKCLGSLGGKKSHEVGWLDPNHIWRWFQMWFKSDFYIGASVKPFWSLIFGFKVT